MIPSKFQEEIYRFGVEEEGNCQVEAVAGSGKTTTLLHLANILPDHSTKIFLAFNKAIANELQERLPVDTQASTFNALGFKIYRRNFSTSINKDKVKELLMKKGYTHKDKVLWDMIRMVSLLKGNLYRPEDGDIETFVLNAADTNDLELPPNPGSFFSQILKENNAMLGEIDFDDQLYLPIIYNMDFPTFDHVFVDECQDLSPIQIEIVSRLLAPSSRLFAVGDERQAIYAFRGANPIALKNMRKRFELEKLPLSICYRCPINVVKEAQSIVPGIEYNPDNIQGVVDYAEETPGLTQLVPGTLTLCRFNAPLFKIGLKLILNNKPCILQTNLVQSVMGMIYSLKAKNTDDLMHKMEEYYLSKKLEFELNKQFNRIQILQEKRDCIMALCNGTKDKKVNTLLSNLKKMAYSSSGPVLSTIHKAKGTEARKVFYLRDYKKEAFIEEKTAHPVQEENLKYVAITRAQESLTYYDINPDYIGEGE